MRSDPIAEGIPPATLKQLRALGIRRGRPLVAVDVDDCLAVFVEHLQRFLTGEGYELRLERYEIEGSMFRAGADDPLPFGDCIALIDRFFGEECARQAAIPGGADALHSLSADAQVVILTNVPAFAAEARRQNLAGLNIPWPVIANHGGKGRPMAWLAAAADAPAAFVDDSVHQIASVARHAPDVVRVHFAAAEPVRRLCRDCPGATVQVYDWPTAERELRARLGLPGSPTACA